MNESPKLDGKTILIGIAIVIAIFVIGPMIFGNGDNGDTNDNNQDTSDNGDVSSQSVDDGIFLGSAVIAEQIDRDGCAVNTVSRLDNASSFYVVAPNSEVPSGTDVFVRLYRDGIAIEDLPVITANQDYDSTCLNFMFETINGRDFDNGEYEAEFWVNGNSYNSVSFEIR